MAKRRVSSERESKTMILISTSSVALCCCGPGVHIALMYISAFTPYTNPLTPRDPAHSDFSPSLCRQYKSVSSKDELAISSRCQSSKYLHPPATLTQMLAVSPKTSTVARISITEIYLCPTQTPSNDKMPNVSMVARRLATILPRLLLLMALEMTLYLFSCDALTVMYNFHVRC